MTVTVGLDPSLTSFGTAIARSGYRTITTDALKPPKHLTGTPRLAWFHDTLRQHLGPAHQNGLFLVEGYAYGRIQHAHQLGELGGIVRLLLHQMDVRWVEVTPAELKKWTTGKGNAKKDEMRLHAYKRFGLEAPTVDEVDAGLLALLGLDALGELQVGLPKEQRAVAGKVAGRIERRSRS